MRSFKVEVRTRPVGFSFKNLIKKSKEWRESVPYEGHRALVCSALKGLRLNGAEVKLNSFQVSSCTNAVLLCCGTESVFQIKKMRQRNPDLVVAVAPTIAAANSRNFKHLGNNIESIDIVFTASEWQSFRYIETDDRLAGKLAVWPCGVDTTRWIAKRSNLKNSRVLVYKKRCPESVFNSTVEILRDNSLPFETIEYGTYSERSYFEKLHRCDVAIFLSESETQGIALAEAWSCNIPTLVWDPAPGFEFLVSAPYLNKMVGASFASEMEFQQLLRGFNPNRFSPRKWVMRNMSDTISGKILYDALALRG